MKLEDMRVLLTEATKRPWRIPDASTTVASDDTDVADCALGAEPDRDPEAWASALSDAKAITALANHADALLELWQACLAWQFLRQDNLLMAVGVADVPRDADRRKLTSDAAKRVESALSKIESALSKMEAVE